MAEEAAFHLLLTTDQNIRYQQKLTGRKIAVLVLSGSSKWSRVRLHCERIAAAVNDARPSSFTECSFHSNRRAAWSSIGNRSGGARKPDR